MELRICFSLMLRGTDSFLINFAHLHFHKFHEIIPIVSGQCAYRANGALNCRLSLIQSCIPFEKKVPTRGGVHRSSRSLWRPDSLYNHAQGVLRILATATIRGACREVSMPTRPICKKPIMRQQPHKHPHPSLNFEFPNFLPNIPAFPTISSFQ